MHPLVRAARRLAESATTKSMTQDRTDPTSPPDAGNNLPALEAWDGGPRGPETDETSHSASAAGGVGAMFGSLAGGMASLRGLNEIVRQLQSSGSWLEGIQELTSQLSPDQLRTAAREAVASLPDAVRADLAGRLSNQVDRLPVGSSADLTGAVSGFLSQKGGAQQLLSLLMVARAGPGGAALSLVAAMKDPAAREFAKSLMGALVRAKGRGTPG